MFTNTLRQEMDEVKSLLEEVLLKLRNLEIRFYDFENENKLNDCCLTEFDEELEEGRVNVEKLEKRVAQLETELQSVSEPFDQQVATLKLQHVVEVGELRDHFNVLTDTVNNIMDILKNSIDNNNESEMIEVDDDDDDDCKPKEKGPTHPTLQQVYDMYQSQPQDEEGWEEMTNAIKAAEEYEASLPTDQYYLNCLTQEEWKELQP